jgi:glycerol uptake facilitator protein
MIGACIGAVIVFFHFFPHWKETENPSLKLAVFSTDPAIPHTFSNLISEIIGTAVLLIGLLAIGSQEFTEGLNPFIVGFYIIAIGLSLGGTTGYAINPARDLGPRIAHFLLPIHGKGPSNWTYSWIPVVGPFLGGSFGAVTYQALFNQLITIEFWIVTLLLVVVLITTFFLGKNGTQAIPGGDDIQN